MTDEDRKQQWAGKPWSRRDIPTVLAWLTAPLLGVVFDVWLIATEHTRCGNGPSETPTKATALVFICAPVVITAVAAMLTRRRGKSVLGLVTLAAVVTAASVVVAFVFSFLGGATCNGT